MEGLYGKESKEAKMRKKLDKNEMDQHSYHSSFYHGFFENYTEYSTTNKKGKRKIIRKYTGSVYTRDLSAAIDVLLKLVYVLMFGTMIWLLYKIAVDAGQSTAWYLTVAELATLLVLARMGYVLVVSYLFAPHHMTIGDYKASSKGLKQAAAAMMICFAADAILSIPDSWFHQMMTGMGAFRMSGYFLMGLLLAGMMFLLERSVPYQVEEPAEREADDEGVEILT